DYTVQGANWRPYNTDLHTSCGSYTAMAVREVLDSGSGDTYFQSFPGQSFNIKDLPNGKYFISVEANPKSVIQELSTANNVSYRKIFLKGTGDKRRVVVPQVGIIDEETGGYF
ncbi:MAG: lysyl oxidase family protein, partial [Nocardioidaceae bacterium]